VSLTLLLGGVRAGKSARALALATNHATGGRVLFVATAQAFDDEMRGRIDAHQRERPTGWHTLESPLAVPADVSARLRDASTPYEAIIVDCLTLWTSNILLSLRDDEDAERVVAAQIGDLLALLAPRGVGAAAQWIIVSNEVGLGIVPPTPLGRRYRDALGRANQLVAAAASHVTLMVAGIELPLKPRRATPG
jgi:adenosylcobinamide kinase/adenosylcobinamide-phosphate guanylyltransferase